MLCLCAEFSSSSHVIDAFAINFAAQFLYKIMEHVLDAFWTRSGHVLDTFWTRSGHVLLDLLFWMHTFVLDDVMAD